jgi:hypothetical protein
MCSVLMCPWRMFFSRTDSAETFCNGKAVSMSALVCSTVCDRAAYIVLKIFGMEG